jgi:hypothetical protein
MANKPKGCFVSRHVVPPDLLSPLTFCLPDVLSHRTFCPARRFVPPDVLSHGRYVSGCSVSGCSVAGRSVAGRSVAGRSVAGRFVPPDILSGHRILWKLELKQIVFALQHRVSGTYGLTWEKKYEKGSVKAEILKKKDSKNKREMENKSKIYKKGRKKGQVLANSEKNYFQRGRRHLLSGPLHKQLVRPVR